MEYLCKLLDKCSDYEIFKSGAKLNTYVLASLGLVYSFWTYGIFVRMFEIDTSGRLIEHQFEVTALDTYTIIYTTTTIGLLWGLHIFELRYIQLWTAVKICEFIINISSLIACVVFLNYKYIGQYLPVVLILLVFGVYVTLSVWNLYKKLREEDSNRTNTEETRNNTNLSNVDLSAFPIVHKTTVVN